MKQEWKDWFINKREEDQKTRTFSNRNYYFTNLSKEEVPFHDELKSYIFSLSDITDDTYYELYHIHTWNEGNYFGEHTDSHFNRKWAYVCELKPSDCNTSLMVGDTPYKEIIFETNIKHRIPEIKKGARISLTVFGLNNTSII